MSRHDNLRGVLTGGAVRIDLDPPLRDDQRVVVEMTNLAPAADDTDPVKTAEVLSYPDGGVIARVADTTPGLYEVNVKLAGDSKVLVQRPARLQIAGIGKVVLISFGPLIIVVLLVGYLLHLRAREPNVTGRKYNGWTYLLLDPQTNTYSLSRAQFILWSTAITGSYVFIFIARGLVENIWEFPPLNGFLGDHPKPAIQDHLKTGHMR